MFTIGTGIAVGAVALATTITTLCGVALNKINKMAKKFDKGVKDLEEVTVKDIQAKLVEEAVNQAADEKVGQYVALANKAVLSDARETIRKEVDSAVREAKRDISDKVSTEISEQASQIDMDDLKRRVRDKAEAKVLQKFDGNLQDLLDKFSGNLSQVQKIYGSIADTLGKGAAKDDDKKITFSLN